MNNFYGHSPPFRLFIQEEFLSVISTGKLHAQACPGKSVVR